MSEDHSSSNSDEARVRKLSYERARRETISEKFRELGDLLVAAGFPKNQISSQADALAASIVFVREALDRGVTLKDNTSSRAAKRMRTANEFQPPTATESTEVERQPKDPSRKSSPVPSYSNTASAVSKRRPGPLPPYETVEAPTRYSSPSSNTSHERMASLGAGDIISTLPSELPLSQPSAVDTATSADSDLSDLHPSKDSPEQRGHKRGRSGESLASPKLEVQRGLPISANPAPHFALHYATANDYPAAPEPFYNYSATSTSAAPPSSHSSPNVWRPNALGGSQPRLQSSQDFQLFQTEKMIVDQEASDDVVSFFSR